MSTPVVAEEDRLLTPSEVASIFRVHPKTVSRWHDAGRIRAVRTPGNHRRFWANEVRALLAGEDASAEVVDRRSR